MNLCVQLDRETSLGNKEAVIGCLKSLLSGHNFDGKRTFIQDFDGLALLHKLISDSELKKSIRL
jgi:hypothetical protein